MTTCSVSDCGQPVLARGYCQGHYKRWRDGRPVDVPLRRRIPGSLCEIDGCGRKHTARGLCRMHLGREAYGTAMDQPVRTLLKSNVDLAERLRTYAPERAPDECWEWTRALNKGYGVIAIGKSKMRGAHIVAWELATGQKLPSGMVVRHTCDNPPCTNPAHLVVGTHGDNVADRLEHGKPTKGEDHSQAKLTDGAIREIRRLRAAGIYQRVIAEQFGISQANVSLIVNNKGWSHL